MRVYIIYAVVDFFFFVSYTISKDKPNTLYRNVRKYISAIEDTTFSLIPVVYIYRARGESVSNRPLGIKCTHTHSSTVHTYTYL